MDRQAISVLGHEGGRRSSGMVPRAIVDDHNGLARLRKHGREQGTLARRRTTLGATLEEQPPAEIIDHAHHLVGFAFTRGFDRGLMPAQGPGVPE